MSTHIRQNSRSISFRRSSSSLKETRVIDIIFQRFHLYRYLMLFFCNRSKGDDDVIYVRHMPRVNVKEIEELNKYDWNLEFYVKGIQSIKPIHPYKLMRHNGDLHIDTSNINEDSIKCNSLGRIVESEDNDNISVLETGEKMCDDSVEYKDNSEVKQNDDKFDIESGNIMSLQDIEDDTITVLEFKRTCYESSNICASYAKIFLFFEFISKAADVLTVILLPIAIEIGISVDVVIALVCVFIPIILMQVLCDWGKLAEKYSELVYHFYVLSSSLDEDKIFQYEKLVGQFRSKWLYCDNLPMKDIPLPDIKDKQDQLIPSTISHPTITENIK